MAGINGLGKTTNISSMLQNFNENNAATGTGTNGMGVLDYNMINSKGYKSALKAYYRQQAASAETKASAAKSGLTNVKSAAADLMKSAEALKSADLYKEDAEGKLDRTELNRAVSQFVKDYNAMVEEAGNSDNTQVLRNGVWMTNMTKKNEGLLNSIGISIGEDNKLTLSETALNNAKTSTLTSLFRGQGSYANRVVQKASSFEHAATRALNNGTYTNKGTYSKEIADAASGKLDKDV